MPQSSEAHGPQLLSLCSGAQDPQLLEPECPEPLPLTRAAPAGEGSTPVVLTSFSLQGLLSLQSTGSRVPGLPKLPHVGSAVAAPRL